MIKSAYVCDDPEVVDAFQFILDDCRNALHDAMTEAAARWNATDLVYVNSRTSRRIIAIYVPKEVTKMPGWMVRHLNYAEPDRRTTLGKEAERWMRSFDKRLDRGKRMHKAFGIPPMAMDSGELMLYLAQCQVLDGKAWVAYGCKVPVVETKLLDQRWRVARPSEFMAAMEDAEAAHDRVETSP